MLFLARTAEFGGLSERTMGSFGRGRLASELIVEGILSATRAGTSSSFSLVRSVGGIVRSESVFSFGSVTEAFGRVGTLFGWSSARSLARFGIVGVFFVRAIEGLLAP